MRNGMNISGFSEIIHEIQQDPEQAIFSYSSFARRSTNSGMLGGVNPACIGVLRAPRYFEAPVLPISAARAHGMLEPATPTEFAIVALAGCFLVSMVSGFSARRTTVDRLSMGVHAEFMSGIRQPPRVSYLIDAQIDKAKQETIEVIEAVKLHSPNHQTFTHALPVNVELHRAGEVVFKRSLSGFADSSDSGTVAKLEAAAVELRCEWLYGTQLEACLQGAIKGQQDRRFPIDQPKQLAGLDWAPNPQEYLLMALAADVLEHFCKSMDVAKTFPGDVRLTARAHVDIRGMCDVAPVPVHLQEISLILDVTLLPEDCLTSMGDLLVLSAEVAQVSQIVRHPVQFAIELS